MNALRWNDKHQVAVEEVPDPKIEGPRDAVIKVTMTCICGSDLHLYDGFNPTMERSDVLGHEPMGEVIGLGSEVKNLSVGDRTVIPFTISCGKCLFCKRGLFSCCDVSNRNKEIAEKVYGHSPAGLFGFSHMFGGFAGGRGRWGSLPSVAPSCWARGG